MRRCPKLCIPILDHMYISAFMLFLSLLQSIIINKATQILLTIDTKSKNLFWTLDNTTNICSLNIFQLFLSCLVTIILIILKITVNMGKLFVKIIEESTAVFEIGNPINCQQLNNSTKLSLRRQNFRVQMISDAKSHGKYFSHKSYAWIP